MIANPNADMSILDQADALIGGMTYTGNDAMGLECDGQMVDVVGFALDVVEKGWRVGRVEAATQKCCSFEETLCECWGWGGLGEGCWRNST